MMEQTRALLGMEVKRRIVLGTYVRGRAELEKYYVPRPKCARCCAATSTTRFCAVDVLLTPAAPTTAFPLNRRVTNQMEAYAADICTVAVNLAGLPALAMPCGVGEDGMPIGLQIIGPAFGDAAVLQAAYTYEQLAWPRAPAGRGAQARR